jgi:hypothetical protein
MLDPQHAQRLIEIVSTTPWLMDALRAARSLGLPHWALAAGAIRGTVWDRLHGFEQVSQPSDLDLVYFDAQQTDANRDRQYEVRLSAVYSGVEWEVVNQAAVHAWYATKYGRVLPPFASVESALAAWPETATGVGVCLAADDTLEVVAPLGLADLFGLVLRASTQCVVSGAFEARLAQKRFKARWPRLRVMERVTLRTAREVGAVACDALFVDGPAGSSRVTTAQVGSFDGRPYEPTLTRFSYEASLYAVVEGLALVVTQREARHGSTAAIDEITQAETVTVFVRGAEGWHPVHRPAASDALLQRTLRADQLNRVMVVSGR